MRRENMLSENMLSLITLKIFSRIYLYISNNDKFFKEEQVRFVYIACSPGKENALHSEKRRLRERAMVAPLLVSLSHEGPGR
jgi:hypothetical protein